jgi:hypothetical protein
MKRTSILLRRDKRGESTQLHDEKGCILQPRQGRYGIAVVDRMGKLERLGEAALLWTGVVTATPHYVMCLGVTCSI